MWQMEEMTQHFKSLPVGKPDIRHQVFVYKIN